MDTGRDLLLLDCGLFQGPKYLRRRNWRPPHELRDVSAVVLSHAHIDHTGYLPIVVRNGFGGPIYCTPATADLTRIMLRDSAHLQEEQAEHANRKGYSRHHPARPLYTTAEAEAVLGFLEARPYDTPFPVTDGTTVIYRPAGHILGSATVQLDLADGPGATLAFSGDLGRWERPVLLDPAPVPAADVLLLESTYGDRVHPPHPEQALARVVRETAGRGGALLVPAFAVGRTQELLWRLRELEQAGEIPTLPVYVDSPMALDVSALYRRHRDEQDVETRRLVDSGGNPLIPAHYHSARTPAESKAINDLTGPVIIISASGMATGGRILHHLKRRLPDARTTVLLAGFQAAGTRGRALQDGATHVRIHGRDVPVRARIEILEGLSAHADREEILRWLGGFARAPRQTYLVHGEPAAAAALAEFIHDRLGWKARPAVDGEQVALAP